MCKEFNTCWFVSGGATEDGGRNHSMLTKIRYFGVCEHKSSILSVQTVAKAVD